MKDKKTLKLNLLTLLAIASILLFYVAFPFILDVMFPEQYHSEIQECPDYDPPPPLNWRGN